MDTSDSECFESADEDIQSEEDEESVIKTVNKNDKSVEKKLEEKPTAIHSDEVKNEHKNQERNGDDHKGQTQKSEELEPSTDSHLSSEFENMEINKETSTRQQSEIEKIDDSQEISDSTAHNQNEVIDKSINKEIKKSHLMSEFENMEITKETSTRQQSETEKIDDSQEISDSIGHNQNEVIDRSINKEIKKSKIKLKLGSKTTKKLVQFEASPEKKVEKTVEKEQIVREVKEMSSSTGNVVEEENLWDNDELDWGAEAEVETQTKIQTSSSNNRQNERNFEEKWGNEPDGWSAWSNWGVSVLSTATQSVSSITSQITNVIETGLGAVDPEELARIEREEKKKLRSESVDRHTAQIEDNCPSEGSYGGFGLGNLVKMVESTGTKVINGGLDTLETIGKKTMEVLQEGDPGLKKKKAFLKIDQDKPVLSQILREAKERAENESRTSEQTSIKKWKNYETLFDDHHGLVHLEALELLSKQCEIKLRSVQSSMTGDEFTDFSETMDQIKELCELPDEDDEEQISIDEIKEKLEKAVAEMNVPVSYEKLVTNWDETEIWLSTLNLEICDEKELHQQAIETLAEMTSRAMEQFHKTGELLLVKERRSTADEADSLVQITTTLISLIGMVAAKFSEKLNNKIANKEVSGLITNVFFEAANSSSYIQDALQLLIPVLQVGAI